MKLQKTEWSKLRKYPQTPNVNKWSQIFSLSPKLIYPTLFILFFGPFFDFLFLFFSYFLELSNFSFLKIFVKIQMGAKWGVYRLVI